RHMDLALAIARDDDVVFTHVADDEVARLGDLRLMAQKQPRARENPFHLMPIELLVAHNAKRHLVGLALDEIIESGPIPEHDGRIPHHGILTSWAARLKQIDLICSRCKSGVRLGRRLMSRLKVVIDRAACCGYGICAEICPEVFKLDANGIVYVDDPYV